MIAIVTDSTAYLTREEAEAMSISVVPTHYISGDTQYSETYIDFAEMFEHLLETGKTSHPAPDDFIRVYDELIKGGHEVLCVVMSSRLSGTYSSACIAARAVSPEIVVIDSLSTAGGLSLLLRKGFDMVRAGMSLPEVVERLENLKAKIGIAFSVESMEPLRRSNRIGVVPQAIGTILNIRPLLLLRHGTIVSNGIVRGGREQVRRIVDSVNPAAAELIVHCVRQAQDSGAGTDALYRAVCERFPNAKVSISRLGPVLGIHLGIGAMGVAWIT